MRKTCIINNRNTRKTRGFTLVEMMVAVALFSVVMVVSIGSLLSLVDANSRAQNIQSVMSNLNMTIDGMVRALRMGRDYSINSDGNVLTFMPYGGNSEWTYSFETDDLQIGRIYKKYIPSGFVRYVKVPITAAEVNITDAKFYITGESRVDSAQPRVLIIIKGKAGGNKERTKTNFDIQASATQRILDL